MPRDSASSTALIAVTITIGILALITPLVLRVLLRPPAEAEASSPKAVRQIRRFDLPDQRLAYPGGCGVGEFKDGRKIAASIQSQLLGAGVRRVAVQVTPACQAVLHGEVRDRRELERAVEAASHPWIVQVYYDQVRLRESASPAPR